MVRKSPKEMLLGIGLDTKQIRRVTLAICNAVKESFKERNETMECVREIERRSIICIREALKFIGDYEFTVREVERYLPTALRLKLLGMEFTPSARLLDRKAI
jgi:hypothetical protein